MTVVTTEADKEADSGESLPIRGLSLTQPWATLVAIGAKKIETRSWSTRYRGRIAIHAAAGLGPVGGKRGLRATCRSEEGHSPQFWRALRDHLTSVSGSPIDPVDGLPLGAIVAVATVENVWWTGFEEMPARPPRWISDLDAREAAFGDYSAERFGWFLRDVVRLPEPVPCKGALGLWDVPDEVKSQVSEMLETVRLDHRPSATIVRGSAASVSTSALGRMFQTEMGF